MAIYHYHSDQCVCGECNSAKAERGAVARELNADELAAARKLAEAREAEAREAQPAAGSPREQFADILSDAVAGIHVRRLRTPRDGDDVEGWRRIKEFLDRGIRNGEVTGADAEAVAQDSARIGRWIDAQGGGVAVADELAARRAAAAAPTRAFALPIDQILKLILTGPALARGLQILWPTLPPELAQRAGQVLADILAQIW